MSDTPLHRLVLSCDDSPGIVAAVAGAVADHHGNIVSAQQHSTDPQGGLFFLRMELALRGAEDELPLRQRLADLATELSFTWRLVDTDRPKRVSIMVSRYEHCLLDLLWRWRRGGDFAMDIVSVISNHDDLRREVEGFGLPYHHIPVTRETKREAEAAQLELLAGRVDLVIMARYMQILSGDFLSAVGAPVINIHHSFLPAFAGPDPYARAAQRGVKLIGATAHYATQDLDEGPIIEQDVMRVSHRHTADKLAAIGSDVERVVLARAVDWHLADRVFVDGRRTVVL